MIPLDIAPVLKPTDFIEIMKALENNHRLASEAFTRNPPQLDRDFQLCESCLTTQRILFDVVRYLLSKDPVPCQ